MGQAVAKARVAQHHADLRVALGPEGVGRGGRGEDCAAEGAAELFQFIAQGGEQGLGGDADDLSGALQQIEFTALALGAGVALVQGGMGDGQDFGPGVSGGGEAAVALGFGLGLGRGARGIAGRAVPARGGRWCGWRKELLGLLGLGPEEQPRQPSQAGVLGLEGLHHPLEGAQEFLDQAIEVGRQGLRELGQQLLELGRGQGDDLGRGLLLSHAPLHRVGAGSPAPTGKPTTL